MAARHYDLAARIDPGSRRAEPQGNRLVGVRCLIADPVRFVPLTQQQSLGQRRSLVRELALHTNQGQLTHIPQISQRDAGRTPREGRALMRYRPTTM